MTSPKFQIIFIWFPQARADIPQTWTDVGNLNFNFNTSCWKQTIISWKPLFPAGNQTCPKFPGLLMIRLQIDWDMWKSYNLNLVQIYILGHVEEL